MNETNTAEFWDKNWSIPRRRIGRWLLNRTVSHVLKLNVKSILEVGCGRGTLLARLRNVGFQCYGIDISPVGITRMKAQYGLGGMVLKVEDLDLLSNKFDLVIMNHLLEHTDDDLEILNKIKRKLKPGGKVLITVPNDTLGPDVLEEHTRKYTPESLKEVMEKVFINWRMDLLGINLIAIAEVL